jgi:hypothetical protein
MLLGGERYQCVVDGAAGDAQAAQDRMDLLGPRPLSVSGAAKRASSRRAASSAESLASPGSLVSTEYVSARA